MEAGPLMIRLIRSAVLALFLIPAMAWEQDHNKGMWAYSAGDYATALHEFTPIAEQGYALAQVMLGTIYHTGGEGVPQDYAEAMKWYRLSAEQGHAGAQSLLGIMYDIGQGVTQDYVAAHMWLNISSANGYEKAGSRRDELAERMLPADISKAQEKARVCMESNYQDCG
jgi:TPR repeat protein